MKLRTIPKDIEEYVNSVQLEIQESYKQMANRIEMGTKEFEFLANIVKKWYASAVTDEVDGVLWADQLLTEELKSHCPNFNKQIWDAYIGYAWVRQPVTNIPEQDAHEDQ